MHFFMTSIRISACCTRYSRGISPENFSIQRVYFFRLSLPREHGNRNYCCINGARIPHIDGEYISACNFRTEFAYRQYLSARAERIANIFLRVAIK